MHSLILLVLISSACLAHEIPLPEGWGPDPLFTDHDHLPPAPGICDEPWPEWLDSPEDFETHISIKGEPYNESGWLPLAMHVGTEYTITVCDRGDVEDGIDIVDVARHEPWRVVNHFDDFGQSFVRVGYSMAWSHARLIDEQERQYDVEFGFVDFGTGEHRFLFSDHHAYPLRASVPEPRGLVMMIVGIAVCLRRRVCHGQ